MILDDIIQAVVDEYNADAAPNDKMSVAQDKTKIQRKISQILEDLDEEGNWHFAIEPYTVTVAANANSVSVAQYNIFRIVSCIATVSGSDVELKYRHITDFKKLGTAYSTTNASPSIYSLAGKKLYVGPGLLASSTEINGDYRRRLNLSDLDYFPADLIVDGVLKRITKRGSPGNIAAWSGWKEGLKTIKSKSEKITEERRSGKVLDSQIQHNITYINDLW